MTIYRGPGGTGSANSDADTNLYQQFLEQSLAARDAALAAQTAAELAETNAETAETNAETAETNAANSASSASSSASAAATSASNASSSASAAASSASSASTSATNAANSATAAASSATSAANSASTATTQASNASSSATAAASSASSAATSATNAASSESSASTSATNAANSATSASNSATSASTSATNAANSATSASNSASAAAASASEAAGYAASINPADLVHISGTETITGAKTFSQAITGSITGNAGTVTNGVYTAGSYADPAWITSLAGSKVSGNIGGNSANVTGTVAVANGGTGATSASAARTSLGLAIGTNVQAYSANLSAYASTGIGFRNRIINGDMRIDQRNAGESVKANDGAFAVDRFRFSMTQASKGTGRQTTIAPAGFSNSLLFTSTAATSLAAGDEFAVLHPLEGYNLADLAWGSASAQAVTLSFWVRSSLTGTFGGSIQNSAANRSYPFSYSISAANTWEQKTVTIPGDTSGTWLTTNGLGARLRFGLGVGTTGSGTAGAWASANLSSATGATSVVGANGATFYITGVQLEAGSVATPFERRPYGTELALCQRYYELCLTQWVGSGAASSSFGGTQVFAVQKRTAPTIVQVANNVNYTQAGVTASTSQYLPDSSATLVYRTSNATFSQFSERFLASAEL